MSDDNLFEVTGDEPSDLPEDPEYGMSLSIGLTASGVKVLVMKLPVAVEGVTPDGDVLLGEAVLDLEDAENIAISLVEALAATGRKPRLKYVEVEERCAGAAVGALAEVANAKVDAVADAVAEKNELN